MLLSFMDQFRKDVFKILLDSRVDKQNDFLKVWDVNYVAELGLQNISQNCKNEDEKIGFIILERSTSTSSTCANSPSSPLLPSNDKLSFQCSRKFTSLWKYDKGFVLFASIDVLLKCCGGYEPIIAVCKFLPGNSKTIHYSKSLKFPIIVDQLQDSIFISHDASKQEFNDLSPEEAALCTQAYFCLNRSSDIVQSGTSNVRTIAILSFTHKQTLPNLNVPVNNMNLLPPPIANAFETSKPSSKMISEQKINKNVACTDDDRKWPNSVTYLVNSSNVMNETLSSRFPIGRFSVPYFLQKAPQRLPGPKRVKSKTVSPQHYKKAKVNNKKVACSDYVNCNGMNLPTMQSSSLGYQANNLFYHPVMYSMPNLMFQPNVPFVPVVQCPIINNVQNNTTVLNVLNTNSMSMTDIAKVSKLQNKYISEKQFCSTSTDVMYQLQNGKVPDSLSFPLSVPLSEDNNCSKITPYIEKPQLEKPEIIQQTIRKENESPDLVETISLSSVKQKISSSLTKPEVSALTTPNLSDSKMAEKQVDTCKAVETESSISLTNTCTTCVTKTVDSFVDSVNKTSNIHICSLTSTSSTIQTSIRPKPIDSRIIKLNNITSLLKPVTIDLTKSPCGGNSVSDKLKTKNFTKNEDAHVDVPKDMDDPEKTESNSIGGTIKQVDDLKVDVKDVKEDLQEEDLNESNLDLSCDAVKDEVLPKLELDSFLKDNPDIEMFVDKCFQDEDEIFSCLEEECGTPRSFDLLDVNNIDNTMLRQNSDQSNQRIDILKNKRHNNLEKTIYSNNKKDMNNSQKPIDIGEKEIKTEVNVLLETCPIKEINCVKAKQSTCSFKSPERNLSTGNTTEPRKGFCNIDEIKNGKYIKSPKEGQAFVRRYLKFHSPSDNFSISDQFSENLVDVYLRRNELRPCQAKCCNGIIGCKSPKKRCKVKVSFVDDKVGKKIRETRSFIENTINIKKEVVLPIKKEKPMNEKVKTPKNVCILGNSCQQSLKKIQSSGKNKTNVKSGSTKPSKPFKKLMENKTFSEQLNSSKLKKKRGRPKKVLTSPVIEGIGTSNIITSSLAIKATTACRPSGLVCNLSTQTQHRKSLPKHNEFQNKNEFNNKNSDDVTVPSVMYNFVSQNVENGFSFVKEDSISDKNNNKINQQENLVSPIPILTSHHDIPDTPQSVSNSSCITSNSNSSFQRNLDFHGMQLLCSKKNSPRSILTDTNDEVKDPRIKKESHVELKVLKWKKNDVSVSPSIVVEAEWDNVNSSDNTREHTENIEREQSPPLKIIIPSKYKIRKSNEAAVADKKLSEEGLENTYQQINACKSLALCEPDNGTKMRVDLLYLKNRETKDSPAKSDGNTEDPEAVYDSIPLGLSPQHFKEFEKNLKAGNLNSTKVNSTEKLITQKINPKNKMIRPPDLPVTSKCELQPNGIGTKAVANFSNISNKQKDVKRVKTMHRYKSKSLESIPFPRIKSKKSNQERKFYKELLSQKHKDKNDANLLPLILGTSSKHKQHKNGLHTNKIYNTDSKSYQTLSNSTEDKWGLKSVPLKGLQKSASWGYSGGYEAVSPLEKGYSGESVFTNGLYPDLPNQSSEASLIYRENKSQSGPRKRRRLNDESDLSQHRLCDVCSAGINDLATHKNTFIKHRPQNSRQKETDPVISEVENCKSLSPNLFKLLQIIKNSKSSKLLDGNIMDGNLIHYFILKYGYQSVCVNIEIVKEKLQALQELMHITHNSPKLKLVLLGHEELIKSINKINCLTKSINESFSCGHNQCSVIPLLHEMAKVCSLSKQLHEYLLKIDGFKDIYPENDTLDMIARVIEHVRIKSENQSEVPLNECLRLNYETIALLNVIKHYENQSKLESDIEMTFSLLTSEQKSFSVELSTILDNS